MKNRPTSAKRSMLPQEFSPYLSCQRLRNVQALLDPSASASKDKPHAILSVLGVDGRYNEGCREFADYLLFGFFTLRQLELEKAGLEEEDIEDFILVVFPDSVSIYCGFILYDYLLPYVSHWKNLQVFCRSQSPDDPDRDTDVEEAYKVKSFISMLDGVSTIGIPFLSSAVTPPKKDPPKKGDPMSLEKWPLIQSYASEDGGRGSFFTAEHIAVNVRNNLLPLYNQCGPVVLEKAVKKAYPLFVRHWNEAVTAIDNTAYAGKLMQLTEDKVLEPLLCYYKHGQLARLSNKGPKPAETATGRKPYVLFGTNSTSSANPAKAATLKSSARKGQSSAFHFVMQCVAPRSPLTCTRTYFIKPADTTDTSVKELNDIVRLYSACVEGAELAVEEFTSTLSAEKAKRRAIDHMLSVGVAGSLVFDAKCQVTSYDKNGQDVKMTDGKFNPYVKVVRVSAENIKTSHKGETIGSVAFADTYVDSSFAVTDTAHDTDVMERNSVHTVLTSDIPHYVEWSLKARRMGEESSSESIAFCKEVPVFSTSALYSPPSKASLTFLDDGKMLINVSSGESITVRSGVSFYDGDLPGKVCVVLANFDVADNLTLWNAVPPHFRSEVNLSSDPIITKGSKCVVFVLTPGSQAYKEFYACVPRTAPAFGTEASHITRIKNFSPNLEEVYNMLQLSYERRIPLKRRALKKPGTGSKESEKFSEFLSHYTVSLIYGDVPVLKASVDGLLKHQPVTPPKVDKDEKDERVCVTIIAGLPCSGAEELSQQLVSLNKEKVRWVVVRPTAAAVEDKNTKTLDVTDLETQLEQAVARKKVSRPSAAARKRLRVVLLAVGFFDLCDVVQCVTCHSNMSVREQMFVGAVTTCIWPDSVYLRDRQTYPKFLEQCLPGIVNNFAFSTEEKDAADIADKKLSVAQSLVRSVNQQAAFMLCKEGTLSHQGDFELVLSETRFNAGPVARERQLLMPALSLGKEVSGPCKPPIHAVTLEFYQPLLKGTFSARLRALKSSLAQPTGSVHFVTGFVVFTDSKQEFDVSFATLTGKVDLAPRVVQSNMPTPPPSEHAGKTKMYHVKFYGVKLDDAALKDWLRKCGRQKPSKKGHKTRSTLKKEELRMLQEENSTMPLPEGYFYNGTYYVNLFNEEKKMDHPHIQKFIDEYIAEENREIDAYNAKIDRQNIKDLFEK